MQVTFAQVVAGDTIQSDYADGKVVKESDRGVTVDWPGEGISSYTWEEVREYGFTFTR